MNKNYLSLVLIGVHSVKVTLLDSSEKTIIVTYTNTCLSIKYLLWRLDL